MQLMVWLPVLLIWLVPVGLFAGRKYITARVEKAVQHRFDEKLERLRTQLRNSEEEFRSGLRSKEAEIAVIREGVLSGMTSRQAARDKRRLEAVDRLWSAVVDLSRLEGTMAMMSLIKLETITEQRARDPKIQIFFKSISSNLDLNNLPGKDAAKERPFVSPLAWAMFSAYQAILILPVGIAKMIEVGFEGAKLADLSKPNHLLKTVLPEYAEYIDKHGTLAHSQLLDELKSRLITELNRMLDGTETDKANIDRAAKILEAANEVRNDTQSKLQETHVK